MMTISVFATTFMFAFIYLLVSHFQEENQGLKDQLKELRNEKVT